MPHKTLFSKNAKAITLKVVSDFIPRLRGLLGVKHLDSRQGLLIQPCTSIHTIGMSISIDVLFLDKYDKVLRVCHNVSPGCLRFGPAGTVNTIELAAGAASGNSIIIYEQLRIRSIHDEYAG